MRVKSLIVGCSVFLSSVAFAKAEPVMSVGGSQSDPAIKFKHDDDEST